MAHTGGPSSTGPSSTGHSSSERHKLDGELVVAQARNEVGAEQIEYYRKRAPWFDDVYNCTGDYDRGEARNTQWRAAMAELAAATKRAPLRGDCVELGVGTGYWSESLLEQVDQLWALDSSPEMLELAQQRFSDRDNVTFEEVDLWSWEPNQQWDSAAAFFFVEHVPDEIFPALLTTLHRALRPGGCFFMAEGAWYGPEPQIETREIDGKAMRVVERRRQPAELEAAFTAAGFVDIAIGTVDQFVHLTAVRQSDDS